MTTTTFTRSATRQRRLEERNSIALSSGFSKLQWFAVIAFMVVLYFVANAMRPHCSDFKNVTSWDKATIEAYSTCTNK